MKQNGESLMSFGAMLLSAWMVITALKWPLKTALFPVVIGLPVFLLATSHWISSLSAKQVIKKGQSAEHVTDERLPIPAMLWAYMLVLGLFFAVLFFGFSIGLPLFVFLYLKFYAKEKWGISIGLTAGAWASFYGLFVRILNVQFPQPLLQNVIRAMGVE